MSETDRRILEITKRLLDIADDIVLAHAFVETIAYDDLKAINDLCMVVMSRASGEWHRRKRERQKTLKRERRREKQAIKEQEAVEMETPVLGDNDMIF